MKIPTSYSPKISVEKYKAALMKVPFGKLHFALASIARYPSPIKQELAPILSKRLYSVWRQAPYSNVMSWAAPYLFDHASNPLSKKWWESLRGDASESACLLSLIASGVLEDNLDTTSNIRPVLAHFLKSNSSFYYEQLGKVFQNEGNEKVLRLCLEEGPPPLRVMLLRSASLRPRPLSSVFWESYPPSQLECASLLSSFGLIPSLWGASDIFASQLSVQDIRSMKSSFLNVKIYQHQKPLFNDLSKNDLIFFYQKVFEGKVECHELLYHPLSTPHSANPFFYHALIEASQPHDLDCMIPLWQKSPHQVFLDCLEYPKVVAHRIKKRAPVAPKTFFFKKNVKKTCILILECGIIGL